MAGPTPDQLRGIQRAVEAFERDWYVDTTTKEIRRKPITGRTRLVDFVWKKKHTVFALYWWAKYNWATERLIVLEFPIRNDNMPIEGFPVKCELLGGWTIPKQDLRYLTHGPLASQGLHKILVPASRGWHRLFEAVRQFAPLVSMAGGAVTVAVNWSTVWAIISRFTRAL